MEKLTQIAKALFNQAQAQGFVDLSVIRCRGCFLQSAENIKAEYWYKEEENEFCADGYKFWVTTDDGQEPSGYDTPEQFVDFLNNLPENFRATFCIDYVVVDRGNYHGTTGTDYARDVAEKINKMAEDQGESDNYDWFERELSGYSKAINFEALFVGLSEIIETDDDDE
jgi:hypothetical protein